MNTETATDDLGLFTQPSTRRKHPETSHAAALEARRSSSKVATRVLRTLYELRAGGGVADQELEGMLEEFPDSSVRARRSDLVKLGLVEFTGEYSHTRSGSRCRLWRITPQGIGKIEGDQR